MPPKIIIFDLMDTVVVDPFFHVFPQYFQMPLEQLFKLKEEANWPKFEIDEIEEADYFANFFRADTGIKLAQPEQLKAAIFNGYRYIPGMEDLLSYLHNQGYPLWVHSNYSHWFEEVRRRLQLDRYFSGYAVSYQLKFRKPDPRAYHAALALIGYPAEQCLFIDDREANVVAAQQVGLAAHLFTSVENLRTALASHGIT